MKRSVSLYVYIFDETCIGFGGGKVPFISIYFFNATCWDNCRKKRDLLTATHASQKKCTQSTKGGGVGGVGSGGGGVE